MTQELIRHLEDQLHEHDVEIARLKHELREQQEWAEKTIRSLIGELHKERDQREKFQQAAVAAVAKLSCFPTLQQEFRDEYPILTCSVPCEIIS